MKNDNENKIFIKSLLVLHRMSIPELAEQMSIELSKPYTASGIYAKLRRDSLTLRESQAIAKILGYHIEFVKDKN